MQGNRFKQAGLYSVQNLTTEGTEFKYSTR